MLSNRKYLPALAILILAAFCMYFYLSLNNMSDTLLQEKIISRRFDVDLVCDEIDKFVEIDNDWNTYDYETILSYVVTEIDGTVGTYAELFDGHLNSLSERSPLFKGAPFDPREYPELIDFVKLNESGDMTVWFDKEGITPHDLYIYFRWVPTDKNLSNRLLVMIGVSKFSVDSNISVWVTYGAASLIVVSFVFIVTTVLTIIKYAPNSGKGDSKCQKKKSSSP